MTSKITQDDFISRCVEIHNGYYDYSKTIYTGALNKIVVTCPKHGEFMPFASHHSKGRGCKKCAHENHRHTTEKFVSRAITLHGNTYDYSKTKYVYATDKVIIICKDHGEFLQTPDKHLQGHGCSICAYTEAITWSDNQEGFRERASEIHSGKYDYTNSVYVRSASKIEIICPDHGSFWQAPNTHLQGIGCSVCSGNSRKHAEETFVAESSSVHANKYDYSESVYTNANSKLTIICKDHGRFDQSASSHRGGSGCPLCAEHGFNSSKQAMFYIYQIQDIIGYGISNYFKERHKHHRTTFKQSNVSWKLLYVFEGSGSGVLDCEKHIKNTFETVSCKLKGFIEESTHAINLSSIVKYLDERLTNTNYSGRHMHNLGVLSECRSTQNIQD